MKYAEKTKLHPQQKICTVCVDALQNVQPDKFSWTITIAFVVLFIVWGVISHFDYTREHDFINKLITVGSLMGVGYKYWITQHTISSFDSKGTLTKIILKPDESARMEKAIINRLRARQNY